MTYASVRGPEAAVPVEVVSPSVGIEDVDDLLADLRRALSDVGDAGAGASVGS